MWKGVDKRKVCWGACRYSLDIFGPGRRVMLGHEHAVGQDGAHDEHAKERGRVKENKHEGWPDRPPPMHRDMNVPAWQAAVLPNCLPLSHITGPQALTGAKEPHC